MWAYSCLSNGGAFMVNFQTSHDQLSRRLQTLQDLLSIYHVGFVHLMSRAWHNCEKAQYIFFYLCILLFFYFILLFLFLLLLLLYIN
jgi:hypothetical protein